MGHTSCGAIAAASRRSRRTTPVAQPALDRRPRAPRRSSRCLEDEIAARGMLIRHACRANVRTSTNHLCPRLELLERPHRTAPDGPCLVVGARILALETGVVDFFDGVPKSFVSAARAPRARGARARRSDRGRARTDVHDPSRAEDRPARPSVAARSRIAADTLRLRLSTKPRIGTRTDRVLAARSRSARMPSCSLPRTSASLGNHEPDSRARVCPRGASRRARTRAP